MPKIHAVLMDGKTSPVQPLGLRFEIEHGASSKSLVDIAITDIPEKYHPTVYFFPRLQLFAEGEYYATREELDSGHFVESADPVDYEWIFSCFEPNYFNTEDIETVCDLITLIGEYSNLDLLELYTLSQELSKYLAMDKFMGAVHSRFTNKEAGGVICSIYQTMGGTLTRDQSELNRYFQVRKYSESELIPISSLPIPDKGFNSMNFTLPFPKEALESPESLSSALDQVLANCATGNNIFQCNGRGECYAGAGMVVAGKVLAVSNSGIKFPKNAAGEYCISRLDVPKLVRYIANYETSPLRSKKPGKQPTKSILVNVTKVLGFWAMQSQKNVHKVIEKRAAELDVSVRTISL